MSTSIPTSVATTQAFINLFETGIISRSSLEQVYHQTRDLEDDKHIAEAIGDWLASQNDKLRKAYEDKFAQFNSQNSLKFSGDMAPGRAQSPTKPGEPNPTSRELLENIIAKNPPLIDDSSSQSKPNS